MSAKDLSVVIFFIFFCAKFEDLDSLGPCARIFYLIGELPYLFFPGKSLFADERMLQSVSRLFSINISIIANHNKTYLKYLLLNSICMLFIQL